jgi:fused signal recognition particle receptor
MLEQINTVYDSFLRFILEINISEYLYEIAGCLTILLLLFVARRIQKRRNQKRRLSDDVLSESGITPAAPPETETAFDAAETENQYISGSGDDEFSDIHKPPAAKKDEAAFQKAEVITPEAPEKKAAEKEKPGKTSPPAPKKHASFMDRLKSGLSKTRNSLSGRFDAVFSGNRKIDNAVLEEIEEVLITADIGVPTTMALMERISANADKISSAHEFKTALKNEMRAFVNLEPPAPTTEKPHVIMVVGVNGVGKTTTIGKLAAKFASEGKKVLLSASDTFRAAAVEQLEIWAERAGADIVRHKDKSDPAAVAFDSVEAAVARGIDVVIVDTAGRLHTKVNLMEELKKIKRSIGKKIPSAPHETFLVLDATTGQNAVSQAQLFNENIDLTGIILTKLDGTAKGGIVLSICNLMKVPIRYMGIGEGVEDLQKFDPALFVDALL